MLLHEYVTIFPPMSESELMEMAADIKEHGQREPITLYRGKVLDGRNRIAACAIAGVEPRTTEYSGPDDGVLGYVISANLHRRHLTAGQRAMLAAQLRPKFTDEARQAEHTGRPPKEPAIFGEQVIVPRLHDSAVRAAKAMNVGPNYVHLASKLLVEAYDLAAQVSAGGSLKAATRELAQRRSALPEPPVQRRRFQQRDMSFQHNRNIAHAAYERLVTAVGVISGVIHGLKEVDYQLAANGGDINGLARELGTYSSDLRRIQHSLEATEHGD